jgi:hypothetical protein
MGVWQANEGLYQGKSVADDHGQGAACRRGRSGLSVVRLILRLAQSSRAVRSSLGRLSRVRRHFMILARGRVPLAAPPAGGADPALPSSHSSRGVPVVNSVVKFVGKAAEFRRNLGKESITREGGDLVRQTVAFGRSATFPQDRTPPFGERHGVLKNVSSDG